MTPDQWRRLCQRAFENLPTDTAVTMGDVDAILTWCLPEEWLPNDRPLPPHLADRAGVAPDETTDRAVGVEERLGALQSLLEQIRDRLPRTGPVSGTCGSCGYWLPGGPGRNCTRPATHGATQ